MFHFLLYYIFYDKFQLIIYFFIFISCFFTGKLISVSWIKCVGVFFYIMLNQKIEKKTKNNLLKSILWIYYTPEIELNKRKYKNL